MPSNTGRAVAAVAAAVVLAYATLVATELLLGILAAGVLVLVVYAGDAIARDMDRTRTLVVGVLAVAAFGYFVVVGGSLLLGVLLGALVVLVGWVTAPRGPLARLARWIRDAREDLRVVRAAVEREEPTGEPQDAADD